MKLIVCIFCFLTATVLSSQDHPLSYAKYYEVPVDTLIQYEKLSLDKKVIIKTIRQWQSYSYSKENLNCQYYPYSL